MRKTIRRWLVVLFVVWHLAVLAVRNTLGLIDSEARELLQSSPAGSQFYACIEPINNAMRTYESRLAIDQGWAMFTSPISRSGGFLAVRILLADGTTVELRSTNEPANYASLSRCGGMRLRKHETYLAGAGERAQRGYERPLWEEYVRWRVDQWRQSTGDERPITTIEMIERRIEFPQLGNDPSQFAPPQETVVARFAPDGSLLP